MSASWMSGISSIGGGTAEAASPDYRCSRAPRRDFEAVMKIGEAASDPNPVDRVGQRLASLVNSASGLAISLGERSIERDIVIDPNALAGVDIATRPASSAP